jgi:hypothetical protein
VDLDPVFLECCTIDAKNPMRVFATPRGETKGQLYVTTDAKGFTVIESGGGTSDVEFDWKLAVTWKGFEGVRLEQGPGPQPVGVVDPNAVEPVQRASERPLSGVKR